MIDRKYIKFFSEEELKVNIKKAQNGDLEARDNIIMACLGILKNMAKKWKQHEEDAFQFGILGIVNSIRTYKSGKLNFYQHTYYYIKNAIIQEMQKVVNPIKIPSRIWCIIGIIDNLEKKGIFSEKEIKEIITKYTEVEIDRAIFFKKSMPCEREIAIPLMSSPPKEILNFKIIQMILELRKREQYIIRGLFWDNKSEAELARELKVSRERIRACKEKILTTLRTKIKKTFKYVEDI